MALRLTRSGVVCARRRWLPLALLAYCLSSKAFVPPGGSLTKSQTSAPREGAAVVRAGSGTDLLVREDLALERIEEDISQTEKGEEDSHKWNLLVLALFLSYALCDLDKVNLSVAVLPIQDRFGLSEADVGFASSSFFWGYMLTQLPGAMLIQNVPGGAFTVLGLGVTIQSLGTLGTATLQYLTDPQAALWLLCLSRALVGLGEGLGVPAVGASLGFLPESRRSSGTSNVYAGSTTGVGLGLLLCPFLIDHFGWPFVFWAFAAAGLLWTGWWAAIAPSLETDRDSLATATASPRDSEGDVPWQEILQNPGVWSVVACHALSNIAFYSLLTWMPTFFSRGVGLNIELAGFCAFLPYLFGAIASVGVGKLADKLLEDGWELSTLRKVFQGVAFFGPAACMLLNATLGPSLGTVSQVGLLILATTLKAGDRCGLFCTHADLSPRHAGALLALSSTAGAIAPIPVIEYIGHLIDTTGSFSMGLFVPVAVAQILGGLIYVTTATTERQDFDG
ncbi:unnamed protein product [Durusdinium trenchii]|uniref:Major facilitator superfamily (MFS) profile domain-containing protein n=1 Tax=Durusdinium trenchii TaxID=1381693 RepID=A0ABP0SYD6_9DINO